MATLYIRNIPDKIYQILKKRANLHRRSINQEAITIIEEAIGKGKKESDIWAEIDTIRERVSKKYGTFGDSAPLIRKDRER